MVIYDENNKSAVTFQAERESIATFSNSSSYKLRRQPLVLSKRHITNFKDEKIKYLQ